MHELGSLLGRWHQWRRHYSHERGYARVSLVGGAADEDDMYELLQMQAVEAEVNAMARDLQLAVQHVARAECLGVEVLFHPMLHSARAREALVRRAMRELQRRLERAGIL